MTMAILLQALLLGYLCGSVPFGLILTKLAGTQDLRSIGSGNIGATNVLRTGNKGLAAATLLGDMLKGTIAVIVAGYFAGPDAAIAAGVGAFVGHLFPVWLKFKGGKGVATFLGIAIALYWPVGLLVAAIWLGAAFLWRISSLAALVAIALSPALFLIFGHHGYAALALLLSALITWMHRDNIRRLLGGEEPRIGKKSAGHGTAH